MDEAESIKRNGGFVFISSTHPFKTDRQGKPLQLGREKAFYGMDAEVFNGEGQFVKNDSSIIYSQMKNQPPQNCKLPEGWELGDFTRKF